MPRPYTILVLACFAFFRLGCLQGLVTRFTHDGVNLLLRSGSTRTIFDKSSAYNRNRILTNPAATQPSKQFCCAETLNNPSARRYQRQVHRGCLGNRLSDDPPVSRPNPVSTGWPMNRAVVSRKTGALGVTGEETDKDVIVEENAEGNEKAVEENAQVPLVSWLSLVMLLLVYISNQWSRSLVYYVQNFDVADTAATAKEFMNVGLGFDETQYGLLASFSFTLLFSVCSLIAGRAVDVISRKAATVGSCAVWSTMAFGTAFSNSFLEVFGLRVLQGSAQAFTTPAAYTMISDLFPASARGTANAVYSSGVYLGGALASLSLILNGAVGWRQSHLVVATAGFAIALLSAVIIREPEREFFGSDAAGGKSAKKTTETVTDIVAEEKDALSSKRSNDGEQRESFLEALAIVFESNTVKLLFAATAFRFCAGFGIGVWCAPFFRGRFPSFTSEFSVINAFVVAAGGLTSSFLGGFISDKYSAQDPRVRAWVPMVGSILAVPCWMGVVSGAGFYVSLAFLLAEYVVAECWFGPTVTILQESLPPNVRGVGQGVFSTLSAFGTLAPPLIGALVQRGGFELQHVLLWTVGSFYAISAALFFFVGESILNDHQRAGKSKTA